MPLLSFQLQNAVCLFIFAAKPSLDFVQPVSSQKSFVTPSLATPIRPEEDILFQWRLRRKIEEARECPQALQRLSLHGPTFSWQAPNQPSASAQAHKVVVVYVINPYFLFFMKFFGIYSKYVESFRCPLSCTIYSNHRVLNSLNCRQKLHIYTMLHPSQKQISFSPIQLQVHLLSLDPQFPNHRPLLMFLLTCIYFVMSCPVPSSQLMLAANKTFYSLQMTLTAKLAIKRPKSLESCLMNLLRNTFHPHHLLHLKLETERDAVTAKDLRGAKTKQPGKKIQRR